MRCPTPATSRHRLPAVCLAALGCLLLAGCAETPQSAFEKIVDHGESGEWGQVWDRIDKKSQAKMEMGLKLLAGLAAMSGDKQKVEEMKNLQSKELFVKICETTEEARQDFVKQSVKSVKIDGDRATLTVLATQGGTEKERTVRMVKEDDVWKISME